MGHYRKRPVVIEAFQWDGGDNTEELLEWTVEQGATPDDPVIQVDRLGEYRNVHFIKLYVAANDEWLEIEPNEWVIKDKLGFYPCKDEIFREKYEEVVDDKFDPFINLTAARERDNWPPRYVKQEYVGEFPPPERCDYGSCSMPQIHLGPHRCIGCGRPCDDPEVTCEVHESGWPQKSGMDRLAEREPFDDGSIDAHGGTP